MTARYAVVPFARFLAAGMAALSLAAAPLAAAIPVNNPATFVKTKAAPAASPLKPASTPTTARAAWNKKPTGHFPATPAPRTLAPFARTPRGTATAPTGRLAPTLSPAAQRRVAELEAANGADLRLALDDATGTVRFLAGPNLEPGIAAATGGALATDEATNDRALAFLAANRALVNLDDPAAELVPLRVERDGAGFRAARFRQAWRGREIWGHDVIVRFDPAGRVIGLSGHYRATPKLTAPALVLDDASARSAARGHVAVAHGRTPTGETSTPAWFDAPGGLRPAWHVIVEAGLDCRREMVVDGVTGSVLKDLSLVQADGAVLGSGLDLTNTSRTLGLYQIGSTFFMTDTRKDMFNGPASTFPNMPSGTITLVNAGNGKGDNLVHVTSANATSWNTFRNAVSGTSFAGQVYDYYRQRHDRFSIDGNKGTMWLVVNFDSNYNNAFWNGQFMVFGNGDGNDFSDLAGALDVTAHEMSHGVIENTAGLVYEFQSGALNEHFADAFGAATEFFATPGSADWLLGEDVTTPGINGDALRNMMDPAASNVAFGGQQPTHMSEFRNLNANQDNGGVHINSGIPNRAFYLTCTALDVARGERIWYRALSQYLMRNSQFVDFRRATIQAATDLFGGGSAEVAAVTNAMNTVGIMDGGMTPPPPPAQDNVGSDFLAVLNAADDHVLTIDPGFEGQVIDLSGLPAGSGGRPTFSDDGQLMAFVAADGNVYARDLDGPVQPLSDTGGWWSVAFSPDGRYLAATSVDEDGRIYLFDLVGDDNVFYDLTSQNSTSGNVDDQVVFADVMEFTLDGQYIVYDALNRSQLGGQTFEYWDINLLRLSDGECFRVFQPLPQGESVGNPALAQNSDNRIAFDYASGDGTIYVIGYDFQTGSSGTITNNQQSVGRPTFSGNDTQVYYQFIVNSTALIYRVTLNGDGVSGSGNDAVWAEDGYAPVWYTIGTRPTPVELLAFDCAWTDEAIAVSWTIGNPDGAVGFRLSTAPARDGTYVPNGRIIGMADGRDGRFEAVIDAPAGASSAWIKLEEIGRDGAVREVIRREAVRSPIDAGALALAPAWPNPTRGAATFEFVVPPGGARPATLAIFDAAGRRVARVFEDAIFGAGRNVVAWDGRDEAGTPAPSGRYWARLSAGGRTAVRGIVVAR
jgi:bacillolysin